MENKLGVSIVKLFEIERKIVNLKINLLDEYFTFNKDIFDFEYIKELHKFLFSDLYYDYQLVTRDFSEDQKQKITSILDNIKNICINNSERIEELLILIYNLWDLQPFLNGNTRSMLAYLLILNKAFLLNLDIDLNRNISNKTTFFNSENFVNQNRLTKNK